MTWTDIAITTVGARNVLKGGPADALPSGAYSAWFADVENDTAAVSTQRYGIQANIATSGANYIVTSSVGNLSYVHGRVDITGHTPLDAQIKINNCGFSFQYETDPVEKYPTAFTISYRIYWVGSEPPIQTTWDDFQAWWMANGTLLASDTFSTDDVDSNQRINLFKTVDESILNVNSANNWIAVIFDNWAAINSGIGVCLDAEPPIGSGPNDVVRVLAGAGLPTTNWYLSVGE